MQRIDKSQLNIILYVNSFLPLLGGREFVVHYLADSLKKLGHKVRVLGPAGFWSERKAHFGYSLHRWPTLRGLFPEQIALSHLYLDVAIWGADIIHAHNTYPTGFNAARLNAFRKCPLVITPHGEDVQIIPELGYGLRLNPALSKKISFAMQSAQFVTAISGSVEAAILDSGISGQKIRRVPNGVDIERFNRKRTADIREWLGIPKQSRLIVTVGRYNPRKGQEVLIRSMPQILVVEPWARLVIVGDQTEALHPLIRELNLQDKVVLTGPISPHPSNIGVEGISDQLHTDWLAEIYGTSEMYVSAGMDENAEGLSLAVLEGMAAGLPIIATDISGNRDVVRDDYNGHLVPPADHQQLANSILRILNNPESRARMGVNARTTVSQFDWLEIAKQYLNVYHEAIEKHRSELS